MNDFVTGPGPRLQRQLQSLALYKETSWLADFWNDMCAQYHPQGFACWLQVCILLASGMQLSCGIWRRYVEDRGSCAVHVSPFLAFNDDPNPKVGCFESAAFLPSRFPSIAAQFGDVEFQSGQPRHGVALRVSAVVPTSEFL